MTLKDIFTSWLEVVVLEEKLLALNIITSRQDALQG